MVQTRQWTSFSNLLSGLDNEVLAADGVHDDRRSSGARPGLKLGVRGLPPLLVRNSLGNATYSKEWSNLDENLQEVRHSLAKRSSSRRVCDTNRQMLFCRRQMCHTGMRWQRTQRANLQCSQPPLFLHKNDLKYKLTNLANMQKPSVRLEASLNGWTYCRL